MSQIAIPAEQTPPVSDQKLDYAAIRPHMQDGDILLFGGTNAFSRLIRWACKSDYSHAGIVAWWGERLMVLEAKGPGVVASPISDNLCHYPGNIDYFRLTPEHALDNAARKKMLDFALLQLGKKYNFWQLVPFFFKLVFKKLHKHRGWQDHDIASSYFCSEYVSAIYTKADRDLDILYPNHFTSPQAIGQSKLLEKVGRLR
ncbi:hypothetical protein KJY73_20430 [Bowmanella sp. Y26]|uniref:YiiX/YebB-like N1pC/P60 family cysteine hydrolase n=1 Tax=Bowmanella yangjiangensis TaxID=2811230 RepID=UPI001BDD353A|nr:YiiX/YebB-like N1pC/P60 family cysteine hydrolase [Bowmanella yangjiangensis]MBT1065953.1 hypothetical protein [Bowmanella yangjiangensis]